MASSKEEMNEQLDELAIQLLLLCQTLVDTKLHLEKVTKEGFIGLAQTRKISGPNAVSILQVPAEDDFEANKRVTLSQCVRQEIGVKFNYLSLEVNAPKVESLDSQLINRKKKSEEEDSKVVLKKDPIRWFGFLVPNSLRESQKQFSKAIELSIEAANVQNEIRGVLGRRQVLLRQLKKLESQ